jgi:hypothetical protein
MNLFAPKPIPTISSIAPIAKAQTFTKRKRRNSAMKLSERIKLSNEAMNEAAEERLARADAIWHMSDEEYHRIIDQWTYKPSPTIPKWLAIVGAIVAVACVLWTIHLLRGGLL